MSYRTSTSTRAIIRNLAVAVFLYMRDGELRELRWEEVDLEHALVNVHHAYNRRTKQSNTTKTGNTRRVPIHENLLPLLRAMHAESKGVGLVLALPSERTMARSLRRWLRRAGVTREELFEASATRKPLTWYDARAIGVTWLAVAGLDATKIQRRRPHDHRDHDGVHPRSSELMDLVSRAGDVLEIARRTDRPPGRQLAEPW